ncbi:MAG: nitroreductase family protein [archaeon]|nr:nitroreductase family protein [archaeon]MCP8307046.1 nitroreductase family protein [archaeon]
MKVSEAIRLRRSIRRYKSKEVEKEKIMHVLEAGRLAPSAANRQPRHFIVITDSKVKERLVETYSKDWFIHAPVIIVACADPNEAWVREDGEEYWKVDVAIALQNMILCATEEGLETCWIVNFDEQAEKGALGIPPHIRVVAMTPLGYSDEVKGEVSNRKPLEEVIHLEHW